MEFRESFEVRVSIEWDLIRWLSLDCFIKSVTLSSQASCQPPTPSQPSSTLSTKTQDKVPCPLSSDFLSSCFPSHQTTDLESGISNLPKVPISPLSQPLPLSASHSTIKYLNLSSRRTKFIFIAKWKWRLFSWNHQVQRRLVLMSRLGWLQGILWHEVITSSHLNVVERLLSVVALSILLNCSWIRSFCRRNTRFPHFVRVWRHLILFNIFYSLPHSHHHLIQLLASKVSSSHISGSLCSITPSFPTSVLEIGGILTPLPHPIRLPRTVFTDGSSWMIEERFIIRWKTLLLLSQSDRWFLLLNFRRVQLVFVDGRVLCGSMFGEMILPRFSSTWYQNSLRPLLFAIVQVLSRSVIIHLWHDVLFCCW